MRIIEIRMISNLTKILSQLIFLTCTFSIKNENRVECHPMSHISADCFKQGWIVVQAKTVAKPQNAFYFHSTFISHFNLHCKANELELKKNKKFPLHLYCCKELFSTPSNYSIQKVIKTIVHASRISLSDVLHMLLVTYFMIMTLI